MNRWLLDTGPLVAYLDARDSAHEEVTRHLGAFTGELLTTSAVVTETLHFLASVPRGPRLLAELIVGSGAQVYDFCRPPELTAAVSLMENYSDTPMDFADASLVLLAEAFEIDSILTLDRRGFSTFRTRRGRALHLVLDLI